jgi:uncharacterized membrane protein (UPF0127 family)
MQKVKDVKIEWALKATAIVGAIILIGLFVLSNSQKVTLKTSSKVYHLDLATSIQAQEKGLSGRPSMPNDAGMLFVFSTVSIKCIWMKDMHFSLDIIWLGSDKRVQHIESHVLPSTYPYTYCPEYSTKYVIELNADQVDQSKITSGQTLNF